MENIETIDPMKDLYNKVKYIISKDIKELNEYDYLYVLQLKILFVPKDNNFELAFQKDSPISKLIQKVVNVLHLIFLMKKDKRKTYYDTNIVELKKNMILGKKLGEIELAKSFDIDIEEPKLKDLSKIITHALCQMETYTFSQYIDSIFAKLSFAKGLERLLKFQLYQILHIYYLNPIEVTLDFNEREINISDIIPIDLLIELFSNKQSKLQCVLKSIIFLNYETVKLSIHNYQMKDILLAVDVIVEKLKKKVDPEKMPLFVEKIITMVIDEIRRPKDKPKKKSKSKKLTKDSNTLAETFENNTIDDNSNNVNSINLIEEKSDAKSVQEDVKIIESVELKEEKKYSGCDGGNYKVQSDNINKYLNNIINFINKHKMGNESISQDVKEIRNLMLNIVDKNKNLEEKIEKMDQDYLQQKQIIQKQEKKIQNQEKKIQKQEKKIQDQKKVIDKQSKDINVLKENVEILNEDCQEMKDIIGNIQYRDLSKNFLRTFKNFLDDKDWKKIRKDRDKKGDIIASKVTSAFPRANKQKLDIVLNLIKNSAKLIKEGNYLAHSRTLDSYEDDINDYKKEKNLNNLTSPIAFCFLVNLGISPDIFDDAYSFLSQNFDSDLSTSDVKTLLGSYLK